VSDARLAQRGFNQALALAQGMNAALAHPLPIRRRTLCRTRDTPAQTSLGLPDRQRNLRDALSCRQGLTGLRIGLVDDVMTSGTTLNEAARTLKTAGASYIVALVVARTA
jgi:predicted amidophosphoribosyltransferase